MKTIRSLMTLVGLSVVFLALSAIGARAQQAGSLSTTTFSGSFTLPNEAQWGHMTLPAGDYSLYYGRLFAGGVNWVNIVGKAKGSPHGLIVVESNERTSATKDSLICIREGNSLLIRKLELPAIGESVSFAMPHGMEFMAQRQNHGKYTLAEAPVLIQRVPVTLNEK